MSALSVIAGVAIEGTSQHPSQLFFVYFVTYFTIEAYKRRPNAFLFTLMLVVIGSGVSGAVATLGPAHAESPWALLIYGGLAGSILGSAGLPTFSPKSNDAIGSSPTSASRVV